jgi:RNA polymerase sigma-70 factor (ECF subfamily)
MMLTPDLRDSLLQSIPSMRAFAMSLTGNVDQADDLVQEAMVRGLTYIQQFQPGTNIQAWLFTILRNQFHTLYRKRRREVEDPDGAIAARLSVLPEQEGYLAVQDLRAALSHLAVEQREALLLVAAQGFSYEEAAEICGTRTGTIKSRVHRARAELADLLRIQSPEDIGADRIFKASVHQ